LIPAIWKLKGVFLRASCPLFFKGVGKGTQFTGRVRLPLPFRQIWIGQECMIGHDVFFQTGRRSSIEIGDKVSLNTGCHLVSNSMIKIGHNVAIGEYVSIRDQEHLHTPETGVRDQGYAVSDITIEDNCWIGRGVYIGPGAHIGRGSIVAANSVVRAGRFPPGSLIAGAPATVRRALLIN
jgi:carbonic anhydrase/acetyltransferase-like protein (isoleucine patch superfamily)